MKKPVIYILLLFLLCFCFVSAALGKENPSGTAKETFKPEWRVFIVPVKGSPESAVGYVEIFPIPGYSEDYANFAVLDDKGSRVPAKLLWSAPGEPVKILFDSASNAEKYAVLFGGKLPPSGKLWEPSAGLIMETRKRAEGNAGNWSEAQKVISGSLNVEGLSPVDRIFHGINPHGPSRDIIVHYQGYIKIENPGEYRFAIAADDAVFLFINGAKITEWPGWHGPWEGVKGQFSNSVNLKKGIHRIDFYNIQNGYGLNMVCGWQPPGKKYLEVIPPEAFVPLKRYEVERVEDKNGKSTVWFRWESESHLMVEGRSIINMVFSVENLPGSSRCKWIFDDSEISSGPRVSHLFFSPGLRKVRLEVLAGKGKVTGAVEQTVNVSPRWIQQEEWPKDVEKEINKKIRKADFSRLPAEDIYNFADILELTDSRDILAEVGRVCLKRKQDFKNNPNLFFKLSQCFIHYSVREYDLADQAYSAAIEYAGTDKELSAKSKLYLAALRIHNYGKCDDGIKLLQEIDDNNLPSFEKRKKLIWLADAYMTKGDMETVENIYSKLPEVVDKKSSSNTILNEARVINTMHYIRSGDYDDAEKLIWQVEWEYPYEAMQSHTGLLMTEIFIKRKEYNYALWRCMRMMNAAGNSGQMSEIMLTLVEIYQLTGKKNEAIELSNALLKEFPYSEAAARLKEKQQSGYFTK